MTTQTKTVNLTICRHGQTDANLKHIVHGWTNTPLNETGLTQAEAAGKALKDVKFHQAYSSDLQRAKKTCQLILEENQKSSISVENIKQNKLLREKNFGVSEGQSSEGWKEEDWKKTHENGESIETMNNRVKEFLEDTLVKDCAGIDQDCPSILIVTHGGFIIRLFSLIFDQMKYCAKLPDLDYTKQPNTSYSKFKVEICMKNHVIKTMECQDVFNSAHLENLK